MDNVVLITRACVAACIASTGPAISESRRVFVSQNWVVRAYDEQKTCVIGSANTVGDHINIELSLSDRLLSVKFAGDYVPDHVGGPKVKTAKLQIDETAPVSLLVSPEAGGFPVVRPGELVEFYLPDAPNVLDMMNVGRTISFDIGSQNVKFDLDGFQRANSALPNCLNSFTDK
jgi:hypothetical protein